MKTNIIGGKKRTLHSEKSQFIKKTKYPNYYAPELQNT